MNKVGSIYSRKDRSPAVERNQRVSITSQPDSTFDITKYCMASTTKTITTCTSTPAKTKKVHFKQQQQSSLVESHISSVDKVSYVDSLEKGKCEATFGALSSDSLSKYQQSLFRQGLKDITQEINNNRQPNILGQLSSLQKIFKEIQLLKGFSQIQPNISRIQNQCLDIQRIILNSKNIQPNDGKLTSSAKTSTNSK